MKLNSFEELFVCLLSDIYEIENLLVKYIPMFIQKANSTELKEGLQKHLDETKEQVNRLNQIFGILKLSLKKQTG